MISVVLPCFNEMRHGYLERILDNLNHQLGNKEIIAVVSDSNDTTEKVIREYANQNAHLKILISTAKNRAQRLNAGIKISSGEIILLHHPATLLPPVHALENIATALNVALNGNCGDRVWGGFSHSFDMEHWLLQFTSWYSNHVRVKQKGIVYLDHCIFAYKQSLETINYVPDLDIFEDTVLSEKLLELSIPILIDSQVITSARRFKERGIFKQALLNQMLKIYYYLGINPKYMNKLYEQKSKINVDYTSN